MVIKVFLIIPWAFLWLKVSRDLLFWAFFHFQEGLPPIFPKGLNGLSFKVFPISFIYSPFLFPFNFIFKGFHSFGGYGTQGNLIFPGELFFKEGPFFSFTPFVGSPMGKPLGPFFGLGGITFPGVISPFFQGFLGELPPF